jgi:hypothetical protein
VKQAPQQSSLFQTFKEGAAFGAGSSIAQSIAFTIFKSTSKTPDAPPLVVPPPSYEYTQCMEENSNDKVACEHLVRR